MTVIRLTILLSLCLALCSGKALKEPKRLSCDDSNKLLSLKAGDVYKWVPAEQDAQAECNFIVTTSADTGMSVRCGIKAEGQSDLDVNFSSVNNMAMSSSSTTNGKETKVEGGNFKINLRMGSSDLRRRRDFSCRLIGFKVDEGMVHHEVNKIKKQINNFRRNVIDNALKRIRNTVGDMLRQL